MSSFKQATEEKGSSGTLMSREVKVSRHVSSAYDVGEAHEANESSLRPCRRRLVGEE